MSEYKKDQLQRHIFVWPPYADLAWYASVRTKMLCRKCGKYPHEHKSPEDVLERLKRL